MQCVVSRACGHRPLLRVDNRVYCCIASPKFTVTVFCIYMHYALRFRFVLFFNFEWHRTPVVTREVLYFIYRD
jgi:hypothetical protein